MKPDVLRTLLARQAIFDVRGSVYAYELLYRSNDEPAANIDAHDPMAGDSATSTVITQLFANMDMNSIVGSKKAFINFTYNHLTQKIPSLLPKSRIVIEVLETIIIDELLISSLYELSRQGYKIALDDCIYREEIIPLINLAHIIKIDVLHLSKVQIEEQLAPLRQQFNGKILAEKIEYRNQFRTCVDLGFDYFQGFFLKRPTPVIGQAISENKVHLLQLLSELNARDTSMEKIEAIALQIPTLSYRILRLSNSVAFYTGKKIESLMDAIRQLGLVQIRHWIIVLLLANLEDIEPDLLERTLIRAKMCELLAKALNYPETHQAYTVGLLSTLDSILNEPMSSLLSKTHLSEILNEALLHHVGHLGTLLHHVINYEEGNFKALKNVPIDKSYFIKAYLDGIEYANSILNVIR